MGRPCIVPQGCRRLVSPTPLRGEIWWCELPEIGRRPVVVLSRDVAIPRLGRAIIAPCTTNIRDLPSEVLIEAGVDPIPRTSAINFDSLESVAVSVLVDRIGRLSDDRMREVCSAIEVAVGCDA
jgi:mRNA interferase MazF